MGSTHGKQSATQLLTSGLWTLAQVSILIGGHTLIAYHAWMIFQGGSAMKEVTESTGLPVWAQVLIILAAIGLDVWIAYHSRQRRAKALKR